MAKAGTGEVIQLIQTLWDSGAVASLDDAELLGRFLGRDATAEAAFAALVRRHAPMVLAGCRDITEDHRDADAARPVTFLIPARKAQPTHRGATPAYYI